MTQEHGKERTVLVLQNDPSYSGQRQAYTDEDEAWRTFLENPLTAATKAMMSVNGDEDSAAALGLLYDYYKVPQERKAAIMQVKTEADANLGPLQKSALAMTTLRTVPFNMLLQGSPPGWDKRGPFLSSDTTVGGAHTYATNPEGALHTFPIGMPGTHRSQCDATVSLRQLPHSQFSPRAQALTPDSTYSESCKGSSEEVFPLSDDLRLRIASITPEDYSPISTVPSHHFEYVLEAPLSLRQRNGSGQMSYLNKGHFYPINLRELANNMALPYPSARARSVVMLVFGEEKAEEDQLKHWKYWHSRQHTAKQRCIDIADYKESFNIIDDVEEIAFNAISFMWDTKDEARIFVSVNCLSTDFSSQKGVKGLPLNLQIDTYSCDRPRDKLVHRAYCQIKVFCDKGAERKIRDEERKLFRRKGNKSQDTAAATSLRACGKEPLQLKHVDITTFKPLSDMHTQPVLFIPEMHFLGSQRHVGPTEEGEEGVGSKRLPYSAEDEFGCPSAKRAKRDEPQRVLLYVRTESEEVFDALMLRAPTLAGLVDAISDKYHLPVEKMGKVYKKCKKGILVHMDDNVVKHYSNEDTFQINIEERGGLLSLTLTEL